MPGRPLHKRNERTNAGPTARSAGVGPVSAFLGASQTGPSYGLEPGCDIAKKDTQLSIGMMIRSGAWISLLMCLGLLAASFDDIPDFPTIRQTAVGAQVSHPVSAKTKAFERGVVAAGERQEILFSRCGHSDDHRGPLPLLGLEFTRHGSDTSPPLAPPPALL